MDTNFWREENLKRIKPSGNQAPYVEFRDEQIKMLAGKFDAYVAKWLKDKNGKSKHIRTLPEENIREHKNYIYYLQLAELLSELPNINVDRYLEAQAYFAHKKGSAYCQPSWLVSDSGNGMRRYLEYMKMKNEIDDSTTEKVLITQQILESIKQSILFLDEKAKELNILDIKGLLNWKKKGAEMPASYIWILNGSIHKPFLAIIKSYRSFYAELDPDIQRDYPEPESLAKIRMLIKLNGNLSKFCKAVIPEEVNF